MTGSTGDSSEPLPTSSGAVSEHIAARRLGVSLDMLRRDRRTGKLGIPYIKLGLKGDKRALVRYDLADLERWVAEKKRVGQAAMQARPSVVETAEQPTQGEQYQPQAKQSAAPEPEPIVPRRSPQTPWEGRACLPRRTRAAG